jgi:general stress protein YciG
MTGKKKRELSKKDRALLKRAASILGRLRAGSLTPERRREIARKGGKARMAGLTKAERRAIQSKGGKATAAKRRKKTRTD